MTATTPALTGTITGNAIAVKEPGELTIIMGDELDKVLSIALDEKLKDEKTLVEQVGRVPADTATWSRETFAKVGDLRKIIKSRIKDAEDLRLAWTGPVNKSIKRINALFSGRVDPLEKADALADQLMKKWAREEEARVAAEQARIRREAEEKALREAAEREKEAAAARALEEEAAKSGDVAAATAAAEIAREAETRRDEVIDQAAALPVGDTAVRKVRGAYGSTSGVKKMWKARLTDLRALIGNDEALALIMAHDGARTEIRKALKSLLEPRLTALSDTGKCEPLAGVEFEQESSINIR